MKIFILIIHAFRDLAIPYLPNFKKEEYAFAFLVHPRDISDVYRKYPFAKYLPEKALLWGLRHYWPVVLSKVEGLKSQKTGEEVSGYIITIPLTSHQMLEDRELAKKRIIQAIKLAEKMGVKLVGLGALTSSVTKGGLDLVDKIKAGVTTGRAYTTNSVVGNVLLIAKKIGIDLSKASVAVVGAAGGIGSSCIKILVNKGVNKFILIDLERKEKLMNNLIQEIKQNKGMDILFSISSKIKDIYPADIIIAATNSPEIVITPGDIKSGAIIINDAQPSDISPEVFEKRNDVLVIEGGIVRTPNIKCNFNMGLVHREDNFCCLAETLALASVNWNKNYAIGYLDINLIDKVCDFAQKLDFKLADFQNPIEGIINRDKIEKIKQIRNKF